MKNASDEPHSPFVFVGLFCVGGLLFSWPIITLCENPDPVVAFALLFLFMGAFVAGLFLLSRIAARELAREQDGKGAGRA